jgi:hypothetical protein
MAGERAELRPEAAARAGGEELERRSRRAQAAGLGEVEHGVDGASLEERTAPLVEVLVAQPGHRPRPLARGALVRGEEQEHRGAQDDERAADGDAARPPPAPLVAQAGQREGLLGRRHRPRLAGAPLAVLGERVVAPEQTARAATHLPLPGRRPELVAEASSLLVVPAPLDEPRPGVEQRLVNDLHPSSRRRSPRRRAGARRSASRPPRRRPCRGAAPARRASGPRACPRRSPDAGRPRARAAAPRRSTTRASPPRDGPARRPHRPAPRTRFSGCAEVAIAQLPEPRSGERQEREPAGASFTSATMRAVSSASSNP